jgi:hypothetical protein
MTIIQLLPLITELVALTTTTAEPAGTSLSVDK